jgi:hypothetical protein
MPGEPKNHKIELLPKRGYNVREGARALGVGVSTLYGKIAAGEVEAVWIFGRRIILHEELERVVAEAKARAELAAGRKSDVAADVPQQPGNIACRPVRRRVK